MESIPFQTIFYNLSYLQAFVAYTAYKNICSLFKIVSIYLKKCRQQTIWTGTKNNCCNRFRLKSISRMPTPLAANISKHFLNT